MRERGGWEGEYPVVCTDCVKYAKVENMLKWGRGPEHITGERNGGIKSVRELCVRETRTVRTGGGESAGRRGRGKWSENQICSLSPPPT